MKSPWEEKMSRLKQELASIKNQAITVTGELKSLIIEIESLKPDIIRKCLEDQRRVLAQQRGFHTFLRHKEAMRVGLAIGIGSAVFGGLLNKDPILALSAGMSGFDGLIRELGETKWCVALNQRISVVPKERINTQINVVSWENMIASLQSIKKRALAGGRIGSLSNIITQIRHGKMIC